MLGAAPQTIGLVLGVTVGVIDACWPRYSPVGPGVFGMQAVAPAITTSVVASRAAVRFTGPPGVRTLPWDPTDVIERLGVELEHPHGVLAQELRPHLVLQADVGQVGEDPLEAEAHREVA